MKWRSKISWFIFFQNPRSPRPQFTIQAPRVLQEVPIVNRDPVYLFIFFPDLYGASRKKGLIRVGRDSTVVNTEGWGP